MINKEKLEEKLESLEEEVQKINGKINQSAKEGNISSRLYQELTEVKKPLSMLKRFFDLQEKLKEAEKLSEEENKEIKAIAKEDTAKIREELTQLEDELEKELKEDPFYKVNEIIMEIRAGAGGEEASLFAQDLTRMYSRFAENKGWQIKSISQSKTNLGGTKEAVMKIKGEGVGKLLRFESGVHRVQRIPETEKSGRVHTSTASVAVLPVVKESEVEINPADLKTDLYHASGPGGQNVNKVETAVRITHLPTNITVSSQNERSQARNKEKAMEILRSKIHQQRTRRQKEEMGQIRKGQIGSAERSEKIRTYNFPQDRITDHRVKKSWHNTESIMMGNLEPLVTALNKELD